MFNFKFYKSNYISLFDNFSFQLELNTYQVLYIIELSHRNTEYLKLKKS